ncbi:cardiolipin synthase [Hazenella sp. IB182357]|uniref:Cardiolipin synthase n=1 Tax=Polycladospora coralii TaxID=2771432 RepID=A0A926N953_9BACL|nr:cardiolipin synthase [Polycladospora coralii]MBD1371667.1 cardiolipin synthase [Polycladospora coralii]MBS7529134.1 cardiolipin synthase [Polycladospora coralii]
MNKVIQFLLSRVVIVSLLIIIQLMFLLVLIFGVSKYISVLYTILEVLSIMLVIVVVISNDNPSYKLAWTIVILILPIVGGLFYLLRGNNYIPKKQRRSLENFLSEHEDILSQSSEVETAFSNEHPKDASISKFISAAGNYPIWSHTTVEYLSTGERMHQRLLEELQLAKQFIFMEYFIVDQGEMWDSIYAILKQKADAGVEVFFMYDDLGCIQTLPTGFDAMLRADGIKVAIFNPYRPQLNLMVNHRDHRKITVIDGKVGFCGGINIADEYINVIERFGHWKDTAVLLRGEAVWNLSTMFLSLWNFASTEKLMLEPYLTTRHQAKSDGYVQPFGDSPRYPLKISENTYLNIISKATRYVYITTPYLIIDHNMQTALIRAAHSGVDVRIITPHIPDKWYVHLTTQSYYETLIKAGVKIYEYTPGFIHAKMILSDDDLSIVGTVNLDYRSLYLHFECGVILYQSSVIQTIKKDFHDILQNSMAVTLENTRKVPILNRLLRSFLRLFAPLM